MRVRLLMCREEDSTSVVADAWDEYIMDENPEGYAKALNRHKRRYGVENVRELDVEIPDRAIEALWEVPVVKGTA